jgi:ubiquinone/menaquinone biosynthesis C-methylase UbiE
MERSEYQKLYELEDSYWWFVGRRHLVKALIEQWMLPGPSGFILDVGCGTGGNLAFLEPRGVATGLDLSPLALELARRRSIPRLAQASAMELPYANSSFSIVTVFDLLYHRWVTNDDRVLRECHRVLRPGGWLLVMDSALPALWSRHDEIFYARQRYTLEEMCQIVTGVGFRLCKFSYANTLLLPMTAAVRWLARRLPAASNAEMRPLPYWLNQLLAGALSLEAWWLRRSTFPIGSSVFCLAQKPPTKYESRSG